MKTRCSKQIERMQTDFETNVFKLVKLIPKGRVTSYGAIGKALGLTNSARMVGRVLSQSKPDIPAHRVVNRNGLLTGKHHFNPPSLMQKKLENEGIKVSNDKIVNFNNHFWDPLIEL